jgi:hypothetical protein
MQSDIRRLKRWATIDSSTILHGIGMSGRGGSKMKKTKVVEKPIVKKVSKKRKVVGGVESQILPAQESATIISSGNETQGNSLGLR